MKKKSNWPSVSLITQGFPSFPISVSVPNTFEKKITPLGLVHNTDHFLCLLTAVYCALSSVQNSKDVMVAQCLWCLLILTLTLRLLRCFLVCFEFTTRERERVQTCALICVIVDVSSCHQAALTETACLRTWHLPEFYYDIYFTGLIYEHHNYVMLGQRLMFYLCRAVSR